MSNTLRTIAFALFVTTLTIALGTAPAAARGPAQDPNGLPAGAHAATLVAGGLAGTARGPAQDPDGSPCRLVPRLAQAEVPSGTARGPAQDPDGVPGMPRVELLSSSGRSIALLLSV